MIMNGSIGWIDFAPRWIAGQIGRQISAGGVDGRLHIAGRAVNIPTQVKLQGDAGGAQKTGGGHFGHARDMAKLLLQWRGHGRGHDFRAGPRQAGPDGNGGEIDLRQRGHRQQSEGHTTGQGDRRRQQRGGHRSMNEYGGKTHDAAGSALAGAAAGSAASSAILFFFVNRSM